ncbi:MAG: LrgB family protein [FCB group bacterium]|jgi:predicted murein hydrolase (TIGR00659 family)|nr:LrgB family protein [FCB group bacterium]
MTTPLLGIYLTLLAWVIAVQLRRRTRIALLNPVAVAVALLIVFLQSTGIPYEAYNIGGAMVSFFLGPAVVAMAVPLYRRRAEVRQHLRPILASVLAGSLTGILTAAGTAKLLGATPDIILSLAPKSVTTPIAIGIVAKTGGIPSLTAAIVIITGMLGAMLGPQFLRLLRLRAPLVLGLALGAAAHGIGTARAFEENEQTGAMSSIAMLLNGLITAVVLPYVLGWIV